MTTSANRTIGKWTRRHQGWREGHVIEILAHLLVVEADNGSVHVLRPGEYVMTAAEKVQRLTKGPCRCGC